MPDHGVLGESHYATASLLLLSVQTLSLANVALRNASEPSAPSARNLMFTFTFTCHPRAQLQVVPAATFRDSFVWHTSRLGVSLDPSLEPSPSCCQEAAQFSGVEWLRLRHTSLARSRHVSAVYLCIHRRDLRYPRTTVVFWCSLTQCSLLPAPMAGSSLPESPWGSFSVPKPQLTVSQPQRDGSRREMTAATTWRHAGSPGSSTGHPLAVWQYSPMRYCRTGTDAPVATSRAI